MTRITRHANTIFNRTALLLALLVIAPYLKPESAQAQQIVVERGVIEISDFPQASPTASNESRDAQTASMRITHAAPGDVRDGEANSSTLVRQQHSEADQAEIRAEVDGERERVKPQAIQRAQHDCDVEEIGCTAGNLGDRIWDWWRG